jgi:hypothetical protein
LTEVRNGAIEKTFAQIGEAAAIERARVFGVLPDRIVEVRDAWS